MKLSDLAEFVEQAYRPHAELLCAKPLWFEPQEDWPGDEEFLAEARIGRRHGPWLHQVMPEHLWPDNEWWWLPEEYGDD